MCDKALETIAEGLDKDSSIKSKKGAFCLVAPLLRSLEGTVISRCSSTAYVLLENGPGVAKVAYWADQSNSFGVKPKLSIAYVQSWRGSFDPSHSTYMGDYHNCEDSDTVFFLDCVRGIMKKYPEFCNDPLSSSLVLEISNWDEICNAAKRPDAWVKGASDDFHKAIEGAMQRRFDKTAIPKSVLRIDKQNIAYRLRAFRAIAKRYNSLSKKLGYPPVKIPKYILDL